MSIATRIESIEEHIEQAYDELQGLGADLTNVNKNIENISMVLDDIYDSMPQVSGEGTNLTLDDTRVGKIKSTLKGNTSQDGTPTPTTPIPINVVSGDNEINVVGKNLNRYPYKETTKSNGGITWTDNGDGTITVNGSNTSGYTQYFNMTATNSTLPIHLNAGTYTASLGVSSNVRATIAKYTNNSEVVAIINANSNKTTFTINEDTDVTFVLAINNSKSADNVLIKPMIEVGSIDTPTYEPYQGNTYNIDLPEGIELCKIGNYQDYFGKSDGRNLFDKSSIEEGKRLGSGGLPFDDTSFDLSDYIKVDSNTQYTYSRGSNGSGSSAIAYYDSSKTFISRTMPIMDSNAREVVLTTPNNATYVRIADLKTTLDSMQFEKGSSASDYQPYGVGKWYLHKEIGKAIIDENIVGGALADSNQRIMFSSSSNSFLSNIYIPTPSSVSNLTPSLSNYFGSSTQSEITPTNNKVGFSKWGDTIYVYFSAIYNSVEDFKTWLASNNVTLYYALATPTNTEITYQPLIDQLNLLEKAMSKDGQTNISQVNNDLPFIISASALKEWQENTSLNSTLSMVSPLSLGNTLNTQDNTQPIEVDNIESLEEEENEES